MHEAIKGNSSNWEGISSLTVGILESCIYIGHESAIGAMLFNDYKNPGGWRMQQLCEQDL